MSATRITDFSVWDLREEFNDYEVSYLWLGLEPSYANDHPSNVIAFRHALAEAKSRGELDCRDNSGRHIYQDKWGRERGIFVQDTPRYQRQSLRKWAILKEQRPLFLFPEDRPLSICSPALLSAAISPSNTQENANKTVDSIPNKAQSTLLKMLDAALSQQYGQNWLDGDIDTLASQWIRDLELQGIAIPAERRAMTRWLNRIAEKRRQSSPIG